MNGELLEALRRRTASASIGASTARNMGKGTIAIARKYLAALELTDFNCENPIDFQVALDRSTNALVRKIKCALELKDDTSLAHRSTNALVRKIKYWGAARKFLNIFLRDVVYNRYLCDKYELMHIVPWLELPLDSQVASGLREEPGGGSLPRWKTVIGLEKADSQKFQAFAAEVAARMGCERVHLDVIYWRREKRQKKASIKIKTKTARQTTYDVDVSGATLRVGYVGATGTHMRVLRRRQGEGVLPQVPAPGQEPRIRARHR